MATPINTKHSQRVKDQRRVMDEASRQRRARKKLESLEQDNFHDDPHADLVMSKKALSLFQDDDAIASAKQREKNRRKSKNAEYYKQRFVFLFILGQTKDHESIKCKRCEQTFPAAISITLLKT